MSVPQVEITRATEPKAPAQPVKRKSHHVLLIVMVCVFLATQFVLALITHPADGMHLYSIVNALMLANMWFAWLQGWRFGRRH